MIELVVVLGLVMVCLGLLMPALAGAMSQSKMTRDMVLVRQSAMTTEAYCADFAGVFPLWGEHRSPWVATQGWPKPMIAAGYFRDIREIDPDVNEEETNFRMAMTMCVIYDWKLMRPGHTVPMEDSRWTPVRADEVSFPSAKGLLFVMHNGVTGKLPNPHARSYCCTDLWEFPVAMADSSVTTGTYLEFNGNKPLWEENGIGVPIDRTWLGVRGIDRR